MFVEAILFSSNYLRQYSMQRTFIKNLSEKKGEDVVIKGWIHVYRNKGKIVFLDLRDMSGIVQGVVLKDSLAMPVAQECKNEWVVEVRGTVNERPENMKKPDVVNGDIELEVKEIIVLNKAETPPFEISDDTTADINEETRLTYRYLDLRSQRMQKNMRMRNRIAQFVRNQLDQREFVEVETPMFTKSTPEGARDFIVPSRMHPGMFYALPQSPQQYKQLLMSSGIERYYQFARCARDEDLRGDRQLEFTQVDLEMSFVTEEDVIQLNEEILINLVKELYPEKKIQQVPFPRMTYAEAMEKHGSDRPDIREDKEDPNLLAFLWITDFPFFEKTADSDDPQAVGEWTFTHNPFSNPKPEHIENLMKKENIGEILTSQYDITLNGFEIGGGSIRAHEPEVLRTTLEIIGHTPERIEGNFGHMFKAFSMGTPPHGGIAWGFDRIVMILQKEPNIREVIAFPKTREGRDPMMNAPDTIDQSQLDELGIAIKDIKEKK